MENILNYELLDSGDGYKLERFGTIVVSRPDPQALWPKALSESEWKNALAQYTRKDTSGSWNILGKLPADWHLSMYGISLVLKLTPSKHTGVFPEQFLQWSWLKEKIEKKVASGEKVSVLNLFGYTGGASLVCAGVGASVCHVDASEFAVNWAHENATASGFSAKPIRFIVDDARAFVEREIKRGNKYDIILLDPPVYGRSNDGKSVWNLDVDLMPLVTRLMSIMSERPLALVLTGYASVYSHETYKNILESSFKNTTYFSNGLVSSGELTLRESSAQRLLSCGIFARWESR